MYVNKRPTEQLFWGGDEEGEELIPLGQPKIMQRDLKTECEFWNEHVNGAEQIEEEVKEIASVLHATDPKTIPMILSTTMAKVQKLFADGGAAEQTKGRLEEIRAFLTDQGEAEQKVLELINIIEASVEAYQQYSKDVDTIVKYATTQWPEISQAEETKRIEALSRSKQFIEKAIENIDQYFFAITDIRLIVQEAENKAS